MRAVAVTGVLALAGCNPATQLQEPEFEPVLERHLHAIHDRNLAEYTATITDNPNFMVIFPSGDVAMTREEVLAFHKEWFAEDGWTFDLQKVETVRRPGLRVVVLKTHYQQPLEDGTNYESRSWLSLTFGLEEGEWKLVHDQNTRIPKSNKQEWGEDDAE